MAALFRRCEMTFERKKSRLKKLLVLAAALGCCSASFSGVLATMAFQQAAAAGGVVQAATA
jgi:hypothetical protein